MKMLQNKETKAVFPYTKLLALSPLMVDYAVASKKSEEAPKVEVKVDPGFQEEVASKPKTKPKKG